VWSTKTGIFQDNMLDTVISKITMPFDNRPTVFSTVSDSLTLGNITMTKYDTVSSQMHYSVRLNGVDSELGGPVSIEIGDVENNTFDSTFVVSGFSVVNNMTFGALLCHIDSVGVGGRAFMIQDDDVHLMLGDEVEIISPIKYAVGGRALDITNGRVLGHITMIDSVDQVAWSKTLNFGPFDIGNFINGIETFDNGDLLISGEHFDLLLNQGFVFLVRMDQTGEVIWQRRYSRALPGLVGNESLVSLADNYFAYYGTGINGSDGSILTQLLAVDEFGMSMCADTIVDTVFVDNTVSLFEFSLRTTIEGSVDTLESSFDSPDSLYNLKIVSLLDTVFCPNDPIMVTLDGSAPNAQGGIAYNWSTGDTTPTLFVEEEGMYMVTVTFDDEDGCYAICDTSIISTYDSTMVNILADISPYCEDRTINLLAQVSGGLPPYDILWSNGEDDNIINIPYDQTPISVTAVDQCEISAFDAYTLDESTLPTPDDFGIIFNTQLYCDDGILRLDITSDNAANVDGLINIVWTNAAGDTIATSVSNPVVPEFGTYTFTALDDCMYPVGDDITISEDDLPSPGSVDIDFGGFESFCDPSIGAYILTAIPNGENVGNYMWSTGANGASISTAETGTYSVTATDCGREVTASFTIPEDVVPPVGVIQIETNDDSLCTTGEVILEASVNGGSGFFTDFIWSTGEVGPMIAILEFGQSYSVNLLDCDREIQDSIIYEPNLDNAVRWPSAFAPNLLSAVDEDKVFGPVIECPEAVTDYELRVYNRVGQLMFETDDPFMMWNGQKDGDRMPGDVYVYYSAYTINGISDEANGTVTLLR